MAFYSPDPAMGQILADLVRALELEGRPGLAQQLSITWVRYDQSLVGRAADLAPEQFWALPVQGASWAGDRPRYPASVVKLVYLVAAEAWRQADLLEETPELRRALADMIRDSSNDATGLVLDLLSGTTSGSALPPQRMAPWVEQRQVVNRWLAGLDWPELEGCNACQKTWGDGPYGREREFYGAQLENRNRLSTDAVARLLQGVMASALVSPPAGARMRALLARSLDPAQRAADPENPVDGFIGAGLTARGAALVAEHLVQELETEGLATNGHAENQRTEKHHTLHRATSPLLVDHRCGRPACDAVTPRL